MIRSLAFSPADLIVSTQSAGEGAARVLKGSHERTLLQPRGQFVEAIVAQRIRVRPR